MIQMGLLSEPMDDVDRPLIFQPAKIATGCLVQRVKCLPPAIHPRRVRLHVLVTRNDPQISKGVKSSMPFWGSYEFRRSQFGPLYVWEVGEVRSLHPSLRIISWTRWLLFPRGLEKGESGLAFRFLTCLLLPLFFHLLLEIW